MSRKLHFTKMQAIGNDYVYVDCLEGTPEGIEALVPKLADRRFGVGGDGVILITRGKSNPFAMRLFNSDGLEGEMCGNGARSVAMFLFERGYTKESTITLETLSGEKQLRLSTEGGKVKSISLNLGQPIFEPSKIPADYSRGPIVAEPFQVDGFEGEVTCLSVGVPHAVFFVEELSDELVLGIGPKIEFSPKFPARTNVNFVTVQNRSEVSARVWERGSGETFGCGTGAAALCVAGVQCGLLERRITVHFRGGDLEVEWRADNTIEQTGPAQIVFEGVIEIP